MQVVSGQPREATHFFELPIRAADQPAWDRFLEAYPSLAGPGVLPAAQTAFMAGYLCHLQADWLWVLQVFAPVFGPDCSWASFDHRLYLHNVLRAYLDRDILPALSHGMGDLLSAAVPMHWLPFVDDLHLCTWRDQLAGQLQPGAAVQTVEVFAVRQGKSPAAYYRLLASDDNMDEEIFSRLPRQNLEAYRQQLIAWNVRLLKRYLV